MLALLSCWAWRLGKTASARLDCPPEGSGARPSETECKCDSLWMTRAPGLLPAKRHIAWDTGTGQCSCHS